MSRTEDAISLPVLRRALLACLDELERNGPSVPFEADFYWQVAYDDEHDFTKTPRPNIGSLTDDWEMVEGLASGEDSLSGVDISALAAILRYLSVHRGL